MIHADVIPALRLSITYEVLTPNGSCFGGDDRNYFQASLRWPDLLLLREVWHAIAD